MVTLGICWWCGAFKSSVNTHLEAGSFPFVTKGTCDMLINTSSEWAHFLDGYWSRGSRRDKGFKEAVMKIDGRRHCHIPLSASLKVQLYIHGHYFTTQKLTGHPSMIALLGAERKHKDHFQCAVKSIIQGGFQNNAVDRASGSSYLKPTEILVAYILHIQKRPADSLENHG